MSSNFSANQRLPCAIHVPSVQQDIMWLFLSCMESHQVRLSLTNLTYIWGCTMLKTVNMSREVVSAHRSAGLFWESFGKVQMDLFTTAKSTPNSGRAGHPTRRRSLSPHLASPPIIGLFMTIRWPARHWFPLCTHQWFKCHEKFLLKTYCSKWTDIWQPEPGQLCIWVSASGSLTKGSSSPGHTFEHENLQHAGLVCPWMEALL